MLSLVRLRFLKALKEITLCLRMQKETNVHFPMQTQELLFLIIVKFSQIADKEYLTNIRVYMKCTVVFALFYPNCRYVDDQ